jgi:hypothetical protein
MRKCGKKWDRPRKKRVGRRRICAGNGIVGTSDKKRGREGLRGGRKKEIIILSSPRFFTKDREDNETSEDEP